MRIRHIVMGLSAIACAVPTLAVADEAATDNSITAMGARHGWLTTSGPDAGGLYRVSINVADLNPATEAGWSAMTARAERGAMVLCEISAEQPQIKGYSNPGERRCLREANDSMLRQMNEAKMQGRSVAMLGLAAR